MRNLLTIQLNLYEMFDITTEEVLVVMEKMTENKAPGLNQQDFVSCRQGSTTLIRSNIYVVLGKRCIPHATEAEGATDCKAKN